MKILIFDFGFWIERQPNKFVNLVSSKRSSDNRKPAIQNPNWVGIFAIVLTLVFGGAVAEAQQPEKVFRIGYSIEALLLAVCFLSTCFGRS